MTLESDEVAPLHGTDNTRHDTVLEQWEVDPRRTCSHTTLLDPTLRGTVAESTALVQGHLLPGGGQSAGTGPRDCRHLPKLRSWRRTRANQDVEEEQRVERTRQRVFIGDVQGCSGELWDLLEHLGYDPAVHDLWFTGDLVNRGPDSLGVLRTMRDLGAGMVLGNHDLHLLRVAAGKRATGRKDTFQDVLTAPDREPLLDWLRQRPLLQAWEDVFLVHAGLSPRWDDPVAVANPLEQRIRAGRIPWDDPDLRFLLQARHCTAAGKRPTDDEHPPARFHPWDHFYQGRRTVVFGHWAARGRVCAERVRGLDTGCVWGGSLTAWLSDEDRFVSVPARRAYQEPRSG